MFFSKLLNPYVRKAALRAELSGGVIIPLLAIILFSIISVFIVLGINARTVKYASISLRASANDICGAVAAAMIPASNAAFTLSDSLNSLVDPLNYSIPPRVELTRARIIIPTMHDGPFALPSGFIDSGGSTPVTDDWNSKPPFIRGLIGAESGIDICSLITCSGTDFCTTPPSNETRCLFQGDVYPGIGNASLPNSDGSPGPIEPLSVKYPEALWHNLANAGNVVACELEAKVNTFFTGGAEYIAARTVYWLPASGKYFFDGSPPTPIFDSGSPPAGTNPFVPGLSIAIATEMTTSASQLRFQFMGGFPSGYIPSPPSFQGSSWSHEFPSPLDNVTSYSAAGDQVEARTACMNPAILVRNVFISSLVEYASRHGHFRNSTEILHINPQHRNVTTGLPAVPNISAVHLYPNYPAKIVGMGQDLLERAYQLPYVFYFGGVRSDPTNADFDSVAGIPSEFGLPIATGDLFQDGFLNPFVSSGSDPFGGVEHGGSLWSPQIQQHHALLASQLRHCYHLYGGPPSATSRYPLDKIPHVPAFEPPTYERPAKLRPNPYLPSETFDQDCPWASPPGGGGCSTSTGATRALNAAEAVAILGSTQQCPYTHDTGMGGNCFKPPLPPNYFTSTYDLRPDLIGTIRYLVGRPVGSSEWPLPAYPEFTTQAFPAIKSPGMFRIATQPPPTGPIGGLGLADPSAHSIFAALGGTTVYEPLRMINPPGGVPSEPMPTSILLILHQRVSNALFAGPVGQTSEKRILQTLIDSLDLDQPPRPITIAYFPTTILDAQEDAVNATANAFRAILGAPEASTKNLFMVFSPFLRRYDQEAIPPGEVFDPQAGFNFRQVPGCPSLLGVPLGSISDVQADCVLQKYWNFLLTSPDLPDGIENVAKRVFFKRLTRPGLKF